MAAKVEECLQKAQHCGKPIATQHGIGKEDNFILTAKAPTSNFF